MITVIYKPVFLRRFHKLPPDLQDEVEEKIEIFRRDPRHASLKTHKLKGRLTGSWSFSVNYRYRVIFEYESDNVISLMSVGDHSVYE